MTRKTRNDSYPQALAGWMFCIPAIAGLTVFSVVPFALAVGVSFTNLRLGSPLPLEFVGLREYARVLGDSGFRAGLANNALFAAVVVPTQTLLALVLALSLNQPLRGMVVFRTLFFMPVVFPLSLVAVVWAVLFAPGPNAMVNGVLEAVTFGAWSPRDFLHHPHLALPAIMLTSIWQGVGFQMVVLLAGLQAIPAQLYEAAAVDGAGRWQRFLRVTLPQLRNPLVFVILVTTILSFRVFDQVRIMTRGGPDDASTTLIFEAVQAGFDRGQMARGAAITVVFFLIVLALTLLLQRLMRPQEETP